MPFKLDTIVDVLRKKASLHVYFQLDLNRSTRPGPTSTARLLVPLLEEFPARVHVSMFRSPSLRGLMARLVPPRFNEGWGTWHAKIYGADNEVIISGCVCDLFSRWNWMVNHLLVQIWINHILRIARIDTFTSERNRCSHNIVSISSKPLQNFPSVYYRSLHRLACHPIPSFETVISFSGRILIHTHTV